MKLERRRHYTLRVNPPPSLELTIVVVALGAVLLGADAAIVGAISCPAGGAKVEVCVNNQTAMSTPSITVSGNWIVNENTCHGGSTGAVGSYTYTSTYPPGLTCAPLLPTSGGLFSGMFRHRINVPSNTQDQYQQGVVMFSNATKSRVEWTFFPNVITVNVNGDAGTGSCPVSSVSNPPACDVRTAINAGNSVGGTDPVLIRFTTSPGVMSGSNLTISRTKVTLDGTDTNGNPWIVGDASAAAASSQDPIPTVLQMSPFSGIRISNNNVTLQGLELRHNLGAGNPQATLVQHTSGANVQGTMVKSTRLDHGTTDNCTFGTCTEVFDLVNIPARAVPAAVPDVTLINVEARSAIDKGIQLSSNTQADIQKSWVRNNYKGNVSATSANLVKIQRSVIERAGLRATDDLLVDSFASGVSMTSAGPLDTNGSIVRNNASRGVFANGSSNIRPMDDSVCGNGSHGFLTQTSGGSSPSVTGFGGVGYAYNQGNGVNVVQDDFTAVNLNNGSVFTANAECGLWNNWFPDAVSATNNQWRGSAPYTDTCPAAPGDVTVDPVQNRFDSNMTVSSVFPTNVILKGQTLRVSGTIFNAIEGNPLAGATCSTGVNGSGFGGQANSCCNKTTRSNKCDALHDPGSIANGNCVELLDGIAQWVSLGVKSVTPRLIETEIPGTVFGCLGGSNEMISVTKRLTDGPGGATVRREVAYCTNSAPL